MSVRTWSGAGRTLEMGAFISLRLFLFGRSLVVAGRLEGVLVAAGARRMAHRRRRGALVGPLVPPDGAPFLLRLDFLGMRREEVTHELGQLGFVHLSLLQRHPPAVLGADIVRGGPDDLAVRPLLDDVRRP